MCVIDVAEREAFVMEMAEVSTEPVMEAPEWLEVRMTTGWWGSVPLTEVLYFLFFLLPSR